MPATAGSPAAPDSERNAASKDRRDRNGPRDAMRGRGDLDAMPRGRRDAVDLDSIRRQRREMTEDGGKTRIITEPGNRRIIRSGDRMFIQHSERDRLERFGKGRTNRRKDGTVRSVIERDNGVKIVSIYAQDGRLLERRRIGRGGREIVLIDNRHDRRGRRGGRLIAPLALGALSLSIPRSQYIVEYDDASPERIYETLSAPPVEKLDRAYTVDEIRQSRALRQRLRRVDLNAINFATGSWDVPASEKRQLERIASATKRLIDKNPREIFLIEGYTDAVGDAEDNLTLSDRRAESIAAILTQDYGVPPENLLVQGYGEQYLKVNTDGPSARNRRVAIRRVTPLLRTAGK
ncbi:MAG: OmpA family protein [Beijerinckiaceae bacterium]